MKKLITIVVLAFFTMQTVNVNAQKKSNKKAAKKTYWFAGKEFSTERPVSSNPEEGGADMLIINKNKTGSKNQGDIILDLSWKVKGNYIYFTSEQQNREFKFKILKNSLVDEYGTKWLDKNKIKHKIIEPVKPVEVSLSLTNNQWIIEHFNTPNIAVKTKSCTITIADNQTSFTGSDGCNTLNGKVIIDKNTIKFSNMISTKMLCEFMEQSQSFVTNLNNCNNYKIVGGELYLYKDETLLMTLESFR